MTAAVPLSSEERQKVWLYFLDARLRYALALLFLGLLLADLRVGKALLTAGFLWVSAALVLAALRPSDADLDGLLSRDLKPLVDQALRRLDPDDQQEQRGEPFAIFGPAAPPAAAGARRFTRQRRGNDRRLRSPFNQAVVVLPLEDRLGIYTCEHDSLSGATAQATVEEHHYRDVVSVRFEEDAARANLPPAPIQRPQAGGEGRSASQVFSLDFTNGRRLSVPVTVAWHAENQGEAEPRPTDLEKTVLAIRALMRDKR